MTKVITQQQVNKERITWRKLIEGETYEQDETMSESGGSMNNLNESRTIESRRKHCKATTQVNEMRKNS